MPLRCRLPSGGSLIQIGTERDIRPLRPDGAARAEGIVTLFPNTGPQGGQASSVQLSQGQLPVRDPYPPATEVARDGVGR